MATVTRWAPDADLVDGGYMLARIPHYSAAHLIRDGATVCGRTFGTLIAPHDSDRVCKPCFKAAE